MYKKLIALFTILCCFIKVEAQSPKMEWFADAKLGIFIHWGIYSVNGISESWSFFNNYTNHDAYMKQLQGFTASKYEPLQWVQLIKESGAKYAVITTKHHDGVALWATKTAGAMMTKHDLIAPFVSALKKSGLKTGLYYSLPDWSYYNYDVFTNRRKRYHLKEEPQRWNSFLNYYQTQLNELSTKFKPDLLWFDGNWEHTAIEWQADKVRKSLLMDNPNLIINSRLDEHGDYETPEQGVPVTKPTAPYWELCYTMNDSWGYQPYDTHYKSSNMIIRTLVDCISMGGNLLLDIGPKPDGTLATQQVAILKDLGRWTSKHASAIYETRAGLPEGHFNGKTALSKDKKTLFLYLDYKDKSGVLLQGLSSKISKLSVIGYEGAIKYDKIGNDYLLHIPALAYDAVVTVIKVQLKEAIQLTNEPLPALNYRTLLTADPKSGSATLKIKAIAAAIDKGTNPFTESNLAPDAFEFKPDINPLDPEVNSWVIKNAEVLSKTGKGIPEGHYQGKTALSADRQTLYLFVEGKPTGPVAIKGLKNQISRVRIVGEGTLLTPEIYNKLYWSNVPGIVYLPIPEVKLDKTITVIAVLLDKPIELYREKVSAIETNL
ncbi:MAG: alpha-L-fucosidase [Bacteroidota bacterium]